LEVCDVCQQLLLLGAVAGETGWQLACTVGGVLHTASLAGCCCMALNSFTATGCSEGMGLWFEDI
jgi:hypothetical protein